LRIYLYHIPPMAGVGFSLPLIEHLLKDFPRIVVGIKDSSGDWKNTQALLESFSGFEVFPGSETHLLDALRKGGAGCISATANVNVAAISRVIHKWKEPDADALQDAISRMRAAIQKFPMVAANKSILARIRDDSGWDVVRPPLRPLAAEAKEQLFHALEALEFHFGGSVATV
jgi:4-hydroxy-tetrahydrodipicolinate synthase